jgi:hypothetical protein
VIKAVLFDLDGTLLPHNIDDFLPRYFGLLGRWIAEMLPGVDLPARCRGGDDDTNDGAARTEAFWATLACAWRSRASSNRSSSFTASASRARGADHADRSPPPRYRLPEAGLRCVPPRTRSSAGGDRAHMHWAGLDPAVRPVTSFGRCATVSRIRATRQVAPPVPRAGCLPDGRP